jgi:4'-phosphopantetheinyl transferase EntD
MIRRILPQYVASIDVFEDTADGLLYPQEEEVVARAVPKRRQEFRTGRVCARRALHLLGRPAQPILRGIHGEPRWPAGVVGSITHCAGYRGAALGETTQVASIGIDAEPNEALPGGLLDSVGLPAELADVANLTRGYPGVSWDRLLFCTKEAVYKAWFPLTGHWLGFDQALVSLEPLEATGTFSVQLLVDGPEVGGRRVNAFSGRWMLARGILLTAIVVPGPRLRTAAAA